jgi:ribose-phosphate pyrophosphokinase
MIEIGGVEIKPTIFPDGTSQIWQLDPNFLLDQILKKRIVVHWDFESEAEIIHLIQLSVLLKRYNPSVILILSASYWPYARQDKNVANDATFARIAFESVISKYYDEFSALDIHSHSTLNIINTEPDNFIVSVVKEYGYTAIVFPDNGAKERYKILSDWCNKGSLIFTFFKKRNLKTGKIEEIKPDFDIINAKGLSHLIVDDICDGGGTFCAVASQLKEGGAKRVGLYCSHLILSKGVQVLFDAGIDEIFNNTGLVHKRK